MSNNQLINSLNNLLEYLNDSYKGYQESAKDVADSRIANLFRSLSSKRQSMAQTLAEKIKTMGGEPKEGGSVTGAAHRMFVNLKSMLSGEDVDAIIEEVKRGENTAIARYKEILKEILPEDVRLLLSSQLMEFEKDLATINSLVVTVVD
jgi:uncharacterized protein (TIGR02284 family)